MKNVSRIFSRRTTVFLLGGYVIASFLLMNFNDALTLRGMRLVVLQVVAAVQSVENKIQYLQDQDEEVRKLRRQNLDLSLSNQKLQEVLIENIRLRRLLQFKTEKKYNYIAARVISRGQERTVSSLILDVGLREGVSKNMPVVTDAGLVGKISKVFTHQAQVQILMDRNTLVSARLQKSREIGIVGWSGNFWLDLNYIPRHVKIEPGENVITSGLSEIYPAGLKIGVVGEVTFKEHELFKNIKLKSAVNFNTLEEVFVLAPRDSLDQGKNETE